MTFLLLLPLIITLLACSAVSAAGVPQQLLLINHTAPLVTTFQGLSAVRHGFDYMDEELYRGMNDTYRNISYGRIRDARLRNARTWYAPDFVMPQGWGNPLNFSTPRFEQFARWVGDMRTLDVEVTVTAGWWFTQNACSVGLPSNCTPSNASLAVYSEWISETAKELVVRRGLGNAATFLLFTEPLSYDSGNLPAGYTQTTYYEFAVRFLHDYMVAAGTRSLVKFMAPNGDADPAGVQACVETLSDVIDIYSSHDYSKPGYSAWLTTFESYTSITAATGKPFYADEGGLNGEQNRNASDYGTYLALWQAALMNAGGSNSFLWLWQDQYYVWPLENSTNSDSFENGLHRWGLQFWLPDSTAVRPAFYAYTIMTRFLRAPAAAGAGASLATASIAGISPGAGIAAAVAGLPQGGTPGYRAYLLINEGQSPLSISAAIIGGSAEPLQRFLYDPANPPTDGGMVGPSGALPNSLGWLNDTLPPRGVVLWASASGTMRN